MIRAIAIDDEPLALQVLQNHAAQLAYITLEKIFTNASEGIAYIHQHKPHALFLDIRMPDHNGMDIATTLPAGLQVIFTTAYAEHAAQGFELDATDYLLKPISFARFERACSKIKQRHEIPAEQGIVIKENGLWHKVQLTSIHYIEAKGNYLQIVTSNKSYLIRQTMHEFAAQLPAYFCRTHKSYIVNTKAADTIGPAEVSVTGKTIPLSPHYRNDLLTKMRLKS